MTARDLVSALQKSGGLSERQVWFNFGRAAVRMLPSLVKSGEVVKWRSVNTHPDPDMGTWTYRVGPNWSPWIGTRPKRRFTLYRAAEATR